MFTKKAKDNLQAMLGQAKFSAANNTDAQALRVPSLYPEWEKLEEGKMCIRDRSKLVARQTDWENMGVPQTGGAWDVLNEQVAAASDRVDDLKEKLQQMENSGKAYTCLLYTSRCV